jgi:hypothetical protein
MFVVIYKGQDDHRKVRVITDSSCGKEMNEFSSGYSYLVNQFMKTELYTNCDDSLLLHIVEFGDDDMLIEVCYVALLQSPVWKLFNRATFTTHNKLFYCIDNAIEKHYNDLSITTEVITI